MLVDRFGAVYSTKYFLSATHRPTMTVTADNGHARPDRPGRRQLLAMVFADVVGYSRMIESDPEAAIAAIGSLKQDLFEPVVAQYDGTVLQRRGDGWAVSFISAADAVGCAMAVQERLAAHGDIVMRMGAHIGEIVFDQNDFHGSGANIAQRLEQAAPEGGLLISGDLHRLLDPALAGRFMSSGLITMKNIEKTVAGFRWMPEKASGRRTGKAAKGLSAVADGPKIAVMPFKNLSPDPEQEYFADGIVEDLTAALARVRSFFVIARNSAFAFKGTNTAARDVADRLGVRYLLEGSVRRAGQRVRIAVELVDAVADRQIWGGTYDGVLADVFDLQDEITESVAATIEPRLRLAEVERSVQKPTNSLTAYDYFLRALPHAHAMTEDDNNEAIRLLGEALAHDPDYPAALALTGWCFSLRVAHGWADDLEGEKQKSLELARRAVEVGREAPESLWLAGYVIGYFGGNPEEGIPLIEEALALNPNATDAMVYCGWLLMYRGDAAAARTYFERAARLSPLDIGAYRREAGLAFAALFLGDLQAAISWGNKALRHNPKFTPTHRALAAAYGHSGQVEDGRRVVQALRELVPGLTVARFMAETRFRHPPYFDLLMEGLRKAGMPEG